MLDIKTDTTHNTRTDKTRGTTG